MNFAEQVYAKLRTVPKGRVTTYKALAEAIGTKAYRAVGTAMNKNPYALEVPCHRVVNSNGKIGGFALRQKKKIEMLKKEGVAVKNRSKEIQTYTGHKPLFSEVFINNN